MYNMMRPGCGNILAERTEKDIYYHNMRHKNITRTFKYMITPGYKNI